MTVIMERNQRILLILCIIYGLWNIGTQWTTTLLSFLQWDTIHVSLINFGTSFFLILIKELA